MASVGLYIFILLLVVLSTLLIPKKGIMRTNLTQFSVRNAFKFIIVCLTPILIYTIFWGLRDEVGTDYLAYVRWFEDAEQDIMSGGLAEYFFLYLCYGLSLIGFSYVSIFILTSFINISSVYLSVWSKDKITLALSAYFYFTTSSVFFAQNGLRQAMASSILLVALHLIINKKYFLWVVAVVIAFFTHHSSIVFALFVFILDRFRSFYVKPIFICILYVVIEFVGHTIQEFLFGGSWSLVLATLLGYENQIDSALEELGKAATYNSGLGRYLRIIINTIVIFTGAKFTETKNKDISYYAYWIFIMGICMHQLFAGNLLLRRLAILFSWVEFPAMALVARDLCKSRNILKIVSLIILIFGTLVQYYIACSIGSNGVVNYKMVNL